MKCALYARVSTEETKTRLSKNMEERVRQDPEVQLSILREFTKARGYEVVEEYVDRASGRNSQRPALDRLLKDAYKHRFDAIIITRIDRMMRSVRNLLNILNDLESWKVGLICTEQQIDTTSAMGRLITTVIGAVAEFESEMISERVREGIERRRQNGQPVGRPKTIEVDIEEAVDLFFELGGNISHLAKELGVSRRSLYREFDEADIDLRELKEEIKSRK